ncbi:MAG: site-specific integrase [Muribaculum sp.]|nr:site-specific integrase [Muribaculum sp.]
MTTVKVKYHGPSADGAEGVIYYQVTHQRKVRRLSTEYRVSREEWDDNRSMVIIRGDDNRKNFLLSVRERIRRDVDRLRKISERLENSGLDYTVDDVTCGFSLFTDKYSLFHYMRDLIVTLKNMGKIRTSETYTAALNSFGKFRDGEDIRIDCLTSEIMEAYEAWHKARGNTPNTISFYTRILRAVYNRALQEAGIDDRKPFRRVYTGIDKTNKRALPLEIIRKIKALDLSGMPTLDYARDMFLMSFYLRGMSFIDMAFLKKTDLRNGSIIYRRRKTGQQLVIGWTELMQRLVDKYPDNPTGYLLPIIRTVGCNEHCAYRNVGYNINHNLKKIAAMVGVGIPVTMYVARHSWASAAKAKGIPLSVISEGMGHDSEATTRIYLASLDTTVVDSANDLILSSL